VTGPSRLGSLLARVKARTRRPVLASRAVEPRVVGNAQWGPPAQPSGPWMPPALERVRAAGLMLCGAIVAGVVVAGALGFAVWIIAAGIHHAATS
jgi:hypothetical protein